MFKRIRNMHPITGIVIGVVATLVLSGTAMAITDTSFTYSTVQTGYLMIGPGDLVPDDASSAKDYFLTSIDASSAAGACFRAPVHLPQGARMTSVRTSYRSGAGSNLSLQLRRTNTLTAENTALVTRNVSDDSNILTFVNDGVPAYGLISNGLYTYTFFVCVGSADRFYGARIAYQYTNAGD